MLTDKLNKDIKTSTIKTTEHLREIKDNLGKWTIILCSSIGRLNIVKMSVLFRLIYKINAIPSIVPDLFVTIEILKLI